MNIRQIKSALMKRFMDECAEFNAKRANMLIELRGDLILLRSSYGEKLVNAAVGDVSYLTRDLPMDVSSKKPVDQAPAVQKKARRKSRGKRKQSTGMISFTDLIPYVFKAVVNLGNRTFTKKDLEKVISREDVIKKEGKRFNPDHLYLILKNYIKGVKVTGKRPRKGGGIALNLYQATEKPTLAR